MKIESIHIKGFKSIKDLKIEGLSDINVFFGQNNVGKSNILEALRLWYFVVSNSAQLDWREIHRQFHPPLFVLNDHTNIRLQISFRIEPDEVSAGFPRELQGQEARIVTDIEIEPRDYKLSAQAYFPKKEKKFNLELGTLRSLTPSFHLVEANRRLQLERMDKQNGLGIIGYHNIKQALFYAHNSLDMQQKKRLSAIRQILTNTPFSLGELDVALDPNSNEISIGFVRREGRLPIESMGSGTQQLLLMLGQIFLNDYPVIALEEPEMNLSPQYQSLLLDTLRQLMQDPAVKLNQLFISTHSPHLEFQENFFHVFLDEHGYTQVEQATKTQHAQHFAIIPTGPDTGARLNSLNQVKLYEGLIDDLALKWGDAVYFLRNDAGRWEIRPENEVVEEVKEVLEK